jgi:hypothetical protein
MVPRTEPMRYDSTVQVGGRTRHSTRYIQVDASPGKRKRDVNHVLHPDYLLPDVAPDPQYFDEFGMSLQDLVQTEDGFAFDEGHPVDPGPRDARESVS